MIRASEDQLRKSRIEARNGVIYYKGSTDKMSFLEMPEADNWARTHGFNFAEDLVKALERIQAEDRAKSEIEAGRGE